MIDFAQELAVGHLLVYVSARMFRYLASVLTDQASVADNCLCVRLYHRTCQELGHPLGNHMARMKSSLSSDAYALNHIGSVVFGRKEALKLESMRYDVRSRSERRMKGRHVRNRDMLAVARGMRAGE